jgi:hypothetical protein
MEEAIQLSTELTNLTNERIDIESLNKYGTLTILYNCSGHGEHQLLTDT